MLLSDLKNEMKKVIQGNPSAVLSVVLTWLCERRPSILSLATRSSASIAPRRSSVLFAWSLLFVASPLNCEEQTTPIHLFSSSSSSLISREYTSFPFLIGTLLGTLKDTSITLLLLHKSTSL